MTNTKEIVRERKRDRCWYNDIFIWGNKLILFSSSSSSRSEILRKIVETYEKERWMTQTKWTVIRSKSTLVEGKVLLVLHSSAIISSTAIRSWSWLVRSVRCEWGLTVARVAPDNALACIAVLSLSTLALLLSFPHSPTPTLVKKCRSVKRARNAT